MSSIIPQHHASLIRKTLFGPKKGPTAKTIAVGDGIIKFQSGLGEVCIITLSLGANAGKFSYRYDLVMPLGVIDKFIAFLNEKQLLPEQRRKGLPVLHGSDRDMVWDTEKEEWG